MECYCCGKDVEKTIDMGKHEVCAICVSSGLKDDSWGAIELDIDDATLSRLAIVAQEENVTINIVIARTLRTFVDECKGMTKEEVQEKFKTTGALVEGDI